MPLDIPSDIAVDLRDPVAGDSYNWEEIEPGAAKKSIVIHATASQAPGEDGFTIAEYHVNHNGWGGVGVHFCVTKDEYQGRANFTGPGSQVHYIGDLYTWRAGTVNQNPGRIHIEISGLFTPGNGIPSANQLRNTRKLIDHLLTQTPELSSLNYYSQVTYHNNVTGQNTACPGWDHPSFQAWFAYLQGGPFPDALYTQPVPAPLPTSTHIDAVPVIVEPGKGGGETITIDPNDPSNTLVPQYAYRADPSQRTVTVEGAHGVSIDGATVVPNIPIGTVIDVAGYFTNNGATYVRTVYSATRGLWTGLDVTYFGNGQVNADIPISTPIVSTPAPDPIVIPEPIPDGVATNITDAQLHAATVPELPHLSFIQVMKELLAQFVARFIRRKI
jgi:N-acetylmuramoyl-L-alanine amidase-like protein